ncbi:hypothetical protein B005_0747 [Nocardiopsis alba ATCC BAA-2165]|uniref:Uncharacterized protein n=1 Tax=Nocardiopsis alba (strain ATCC BAA-2165 / BE74) TaxID=1205910 RepID=J7LE22_NOCAA|nr:hypothetical protein B005_0747 [Nocardiopsis alba ATCC BAA-2165]
MSRGEVPPQVLPRAGTVTHRSRGPPRDRRPVGTPVCGPVSDGR